MTNGIPTRRTMIKGGLIAAATSSVLAGSASADGHRTRYPRIGERVVALSDGSVIGLSAASTSARVREPSPEILAGQVEFSNELIGRLVWVSHQNGRGDPRTISQDTANELSSVTEAIMAQEADTMEALRNSPLYWVQENPVFLYAPFAPYIVGGLTSLVVVPFVHGFFSQLGSRAADWLLDQFD